MICSGMFILPYSPRWLVTQGRHEEARLTLLRLHGGIRNAHEEAIEAEYQEIYTQVKWGACIRRPQRTTRH